MKGNTQGGACVAVEVEAPAAAGFTDCIGQTPVTVRVKNGEEKSVCAEICLRADFLLPCETRLEIPAHGEAEWRAEGVFSPLFFTENGRAEQRRAEVLVRACGKKSVHAFTVLCLPFDWWAGTGGDVRALARLVRPHSRPSEELLVSAAERLKKWGRPFGYGAGKNGARDAVAALYAAVLAVRFSREEEDLSRPLPAVCENDLARRRSAPLRLCLLFAACLERAGLNPVLALGKESVAVGAWLYDACFLDPVHEDAETVKKYAERGVDNLCLIDAEDLFSPHASALAPAEEGFRTRLAAGAYRVFADIRRCRAEGISPCPARICTERGYELTGEEELSAETPPAPLPEPASPARTAEQAWEQGLLELSDGNTLLRFTAKDALHLAPPSWEGLRSGSLRLVSAGEAPRFGGRQTKQRELLARLQGEKGLLGAYASEEEIGRTASLLFRRGKEESGARALCFACGFLRYRTKAGTAYAPLVLLPAAVERTRAGYAVRAAGESFFNSTLAEFLKREGFELRGFEDGEEIGGVLSAVRAETAGEEGWEVFGDVYLASFSFKRYVIWNDLHAHLSSFEKNAAVAALLKREQFPPNPPPAQKISLYLSADSSQREAIALAATGGSFVLHGPPGTGKSQTIANMIANVLERGGRALFVAEKRAAVEVVKKRLAEIGIGEFCLDLNAESERQEIVRRLERNLALPREEAAEGGDEEFAEVCARLFASSNALRREREGGLSVVRAVARYFGLESAPAIADPAELSLLPAYREAILAASSARDGCGFLFENVGLSDCPQGLKEQLVLVCRVVQTEARHLKGYLGLLLRIFRQRGGAFPRRKLEALCALVRDLASGAYDGYFTGTTEETFLRVTRANARLGDLLNYYFRHFRSLIVPRGQAGMRRAERRLARVALHPIEKEDAPKYRDTLLGIADAVRELREGGAACFCGGKFSNKKREEYFKDLSDLHERCADLFADFDAEAFDRACVRAAGEREHLNGFLRAAESCFAAAEEFFSLTRADRDLTGEDLCGYLADRASELAEHAEQLSGYCAFRAATDKLAGLGLPSLAAALASGRMDGETALAAVEKRALSRFLEEALQDGALLSSEAYCGCAAKYRKLSAECMRRARVRLRAALCSRLNEGDGAERAALNGKGKGVGALFAEAPALLARAFPCLMASPAAVARLLPPSEDFDLVVFDEASQTSTAEAIGSLARAKAAVIAGDPLQLPPTPFFSTVSAESVLDDCLVCGFPEKRLHWHYRSRHESLIAFPNAAFYGGGLRSFPSPERTSRVRFVKVEGTYARGGKRCNAAETEAIVSELSRRLSDAALQDLSVGIVTFSAAQREAIEHAIEEKFGIRGAENLVLGGEPLFVRNLENVQGDERDAVLFSVGYGPDGGGKLSRNFGPLNREGGWRRLNVAVTRAREEIVVFSSMTHRDIGARTSSRGVKELRDFLEFAETGRTAAVGEGEAGPAARRLASELASCGFECLSGVGSSECRVDVAISDPAEKSRFLLGVLTDEHVFSAEDEIVREDGLKRAGWKLVRVSCAEIYRDPARAAAKVRAALPQKEGGAAWLKGYARPYRAVKATGAETASFVTGGAHDAEIAARIRAIVAREEPLSRAFLKKRTLSSFGIARGGPRTDARLDALIDGCGLPRERVAGVEYFYRNARAVTVGKFRAGGDPVRRNGEDFSVFETLAFLKGALEERSALYEDELCDLFCTTFPEARRSARLYAYLRGCVACGEERGLFVRSASDRISLA